MPPGWSPPADLSLSTSLLASFDNVSPAFVFCCFEQKDSTCVASLLPPPSPFSAFFDFLGFYLFVLHNRLNPAAGGSVLSRCFRSGPSLIAGLRQRGKLRGSACNSACAALQLIAWPSISSVCGNPPPSRKAARVFPTDTTRRRAAPFHRTERSSRRH